MSHQALARKWRPKRFEDVIGQRGVVDTLRNAISSGRLAQSFIFAGPRGVGKTTTARILACALNCVEGPSGFPCGKCDACVEIAEGRSMDVLEIDAATHTGVDDVREVIVEPLAIAPMRDRFKIFIIDEVHRLSKQAFDALLKSIEEPPAYVKFMMATTDLHAVPATIQSRSQVFELKTLPFTSIREQLRALMVKEAIDVDDGALALVARAAEGSMRDALSALDQVLAFSADKVTAETVSTVLGLIGRDLQFEIVETVARQDLAGAFTVAEKVVEGGFDPRVVCRELARLMRDLMVISIDPTRLKDAEVASEDERPRLQALAKAYSREDLMRSFDLLSRAEFDIRGSSQPRHHFEMALVKWIHMRQLTPLSELIAGLDQTGARPIGGAGAPARSAPPARPPAPVRSAAPGAAASERSFGPASFSPPPPPPASRPAPAPFAPARPATPPATAPTRPSPAAPAAAAAPAAGKASDAPAGDLKAALLAAIREQSKSFYGLVIAQVQKVEVEGDSIAFTFSSVHKSSRLQLEAKRAWIEQLAQGIAGRRLAVVTRELAPVAPSPADAPPADGRKADLQARARAEPTVQAVLDVFGGEIEDVEEL